MLPQSLLVLASAALALAGPVRHRDVKGCPARTPKPPKPTETTTAPAADSTTATTTSGAASTSAIPSTTYVTPTVPTQGLTALAPPPEGLVLKRIALGFGIQNYTCASANMSAKGVAAGALASLYDVTSLFPDSSPDALSPAAWAALGTTLLHSQTLPLNLDPNAPTSVGGHQSFACLTPPFKPAADLPLGSTNLVHTGFHYFDANKVPTFELDGGLLFKGGKKDGVKPPAGADAGVLGSGAVDWLLLEANADAKGVSLVYRVVTAGGVQAACDIAGGESVPYTAFYWFFGPPS